MARVQPNYSDVLSSLVAYCCKKRSDKNVKRV